jgi:signal transduction histidine kinase
MTELLLNTGLDTTQRRYAETLQQSAKSLHAVLKDILDYSKLEAGRFELDSAVFDLHELIKSVGNEFRRSGCFSPTSRPTITAASMAAPDLDSPSPGASSS